jgi:wyosine [tRNA(Phe)-imidazoG37] synthetase (radical SAM superfamily)
MFLGMGYLFGAVNSRRLGRSLGLDLVPTKICTATRIYRGLAREGDEAKALTLLNSQAK